VTDILNILTGSLYIKVDKDVKYLTFFNTEQSSYSSAKRNPTNSKSSSSPGGGKWARMQLTAQDGRTTRMSFPTILPNTIALAGGMRHGERFCAQDLHMLYFQTAFYSPTKQPVKPIYLNRLYGNLDYLFCNYMAGLALCIL
jgi:hypothetical protein